MSSHNSWRRVHGSCCERPFYGGTYKLIENCSYFYFFYLHLHWLFDFYVPVSDLTLVFNSIYKTISWKNILKFNMQRQKNLIVVFLEVNINIKIHLHCLLIKTDALPCVVMTPTFPLDLLFCFYSWTFMLLFLIYFEEESS